VPFSKRKTRRSLPQRLNDQRRSLVLAGLAAGAAFSAVVLRRKRRGADAGPEPSVQSEENVPVVAPQAEAPVAAPEPVAPAAPAESGPPPAAEVPPAADEPEQAPSPEAINAAPAGGDDPAAEGDPDAEPAPVEPATGELSAEEASVLAVLAQSGRADDDRTAIAVATSLERETGDVADVLRKLGAEGVVSGELYTAAGDKIWAVTERGVRRLGAQS
jgi:hypothetical protein